MEREGSKPEASVYRPRGWACARAREPRRRQGRQPHAALALPPPPRSKRARPPARWTPAPSSCPDSRVPRETLRATHAVRVGPAGGRPSRAECASSTAGLGPHMAPPGISSGGGRALLLDPWLVTRITLGYKEGRCVKQPRNGRRQIWDSPRLGFICCLSELSPHVLCCGGSPASCPPPPQMVWLSCPHGRERGPSSLLPTIARTSFEV